MAFFSFYPILLDIYITNYPPDHKKIRKDKGEDARGHFGIFHYIVDWKSGSSRQSNRGKIQGKSPWDCPWELPAVWKIDLDQTPLLFNLMCRPYRTEPTSQEKVKKAFVRLNSTFSGSPESSVLEENIVEGRIEEDKLLFRGFSNIVTVRGDQNQSTTM